MLQHLLFLCISGLLMFHSIAVAETKESGLIQILKEASVLQPGRIIELEREGSLDEAYYEIKILSEKGQIDALHFTVDGQFLRRQTDHEENTLLFVHAKLRPLQDIIKNIPDLDTLQEIELIWCRGQLLYQIEMGLDPTVFSFVDAIQGNMLDTHEPEYCG